MNKPKIINKLGRRGKIVLTLLVAVMFIGIASAALIPHFGRITTTATVSQQAVQISEDGINWLSYDNPIEHIIPDASPCETYCFGQWIRNNAPIPVDVTFTNDDPAGITTTYSIPAVYSFDETIKGVHITVEDTGDGWLLWTYTGDDTTREVPKMTVAIDYPTGFAITTFDDGVHDGWYYAPDPDVESSRVRFGDYSGASYDKWVVTTASGNVLTVKILKSALGDSFKWHGYANFYNEQCWINDQLTGDGYEVNQFVVNLWQPLTIPFTMQSDEILQFRICHAFALDIGEGTYGLTTIVDATEHI